MDTAEYERMHRIEDEHWWYVGMREIMRALTPHLPPDARVLDAGCGTGRNLADLAMANRAYGVDASSLALELCHTRALTRLSRASVCELPFADETFDAVISYDVLYHLNVRNDAIAFNEFFRVLQTGGHLLVRLPAHDWLRSQHDRAVHTRQRYTAYEVADKLTRAGFTLQRIGYANSFLFLPAAFKRLLEPLLRSNNESSDLDLPSPHINALLSSILKTESKLIARGINLPFGLSVIALATKKGRSVKTPRPLNF
jgi:ubiquinone/menaquinone biosynthesis C-methylase UbiE